MKRPPGVRFRNWGVGLEVTLRRITDAPSAAFFRVLATSIMRPAHAIKNMGRTLRPSLPTGVAANESRPVPPRNLPLTSFSVKMPHQQMVRE